MPRIGLVSDTHNHPHPALFGVLTGVDLVIHAGDICRGEVLEALHAVAPVAAVHGNCCEWPLQATLPAERRLTLAGTDVLVRHEIGKPQGYRRRLAKGGDRAALPHIVVSGHSHQPHWVELGGVWFVNPGSAGPRRFESRPSVAVLTLFQRKSPRVDFFELEKV